MHVLLNVFLRHSGEWSVDHLMKKRISERPIILTVLGRQIRKHIETQFEMADRFAVLKGGIACLPRGPGRTNRRMASFFLLGIFSEPNRAEYCVKKAGYRLVCSSEVNILSQHLRLISSAIHTATVAPALQTLSCARICHP